MTAEEYQKEYEIILKKRNTDDGQEVKINSKSPVAKLFPNDYKKELIFQQELKVISDERLKSAKDFFIDQIVEILTERLLKALCLRAFSPEESPITLITPDTKCISVIIKAGPCTSATGDIFFLVKFNDVIKYSAETKKVIDLSELTFPIDQDEILNLVYGK